MDDSVEQWVRDSLGRLDALPAWDGLTDRQRERWLSHVRRATSDDDRRRRAAAVAVAATEPGELAAGPRGGLVVRAGRAVGDVLVP